jgi:hypothetical protein
VSVVLVFAFIALASMTAAGYLVGIRHSIRAKNLALREAAAAAGRIAEAQTIAHAARTEADRVWTLVEQATSETERLRSVVQEILESARASQREYDDTMEALEDASQRVVQAETQLRRFEVFSEQQQKMAMRREEILTHSTLELRTIRLEAQHLKDKAQNIAATRERIERELATARETAREATTVAQKEREEASRAKLTATAATDEVRRAREYESRQHEVHVRREEDLKIARQREQEAYNELARAHAAMAVMSQELARKGVQESHVQSLRDEVKSLAKKFLTEPAPPFVKTLPPQGRISSVPQAMPR